MIEVRPVMPWVKVYITEGDASVMYSWCKEVIGPDGVNWYVNIQNRHRHDLFYAFRYEEDATAFKLRFEL